MDANDETLKLKEILAGIYEKLKNLDRNALDEHYLNERYLHHYFSHEVQSKSTYNLDYGNRCKSTFHPEWTTQGRYQEENGVYQLASNGTQGNIDFTLGNYCHPEYAIEFKHSSGWNVKALRFDYVKLLDSNNNIGRAISLAVIFRKAELTDKERREALDRLKIELGDRLAADRQFLFVIVQVAPGETTEGIRSWYCNNLAEGFQPMTELKDIWF